MFNKKRQKEGILRGINFAIKATNLNDSYSVGFRNGLRYAKFLIDGKEPEFERVEVE